MAKIVTEELPVPNFGPNMQADMTEYNVRYLKANLEDPGERTELEIIETRSLDPKSGIVLLTADKFTFMDKYIVIIKFLEKKTA